MVRGDMDSAEAFAREAFQVAPDNPYILDILLSVLIKSERKIGLRYPLSLRG
jgi:hypothetical protein